MGGGWGVGGGGRESLEIRRELYEQSPPITATSGDPDVFVSRRCIRMGKRQDRSPLSNPVPEPLFVSTGFNDRRGISHQQSPGAPAQIRALFA